MAWHIGVPSRYVMRPRPNARHHIYCIQCTYILQCHSETNIGNIVPISPSSKTMFHFLLRDLVFFRFLLSLSFPFFFRLHIPNKPNDNKQNEVNEHARYKCAFPSRERKKREERGWGGRAQCEIEPKSDIETKLEMSI